MPFIAVTPEDTDYEIDVPVLGKFPMDWDVFMVTEDSLEVKLFDAVLDCLDQRWGVDDAHIHSMGFSLGGITTDMLANMRGEELASVATYSGGYWSTPGNVDPLLEAFIQWPPYTVQNEYAQLFLHGGPADSFPLGITSLQFDEFAAADATLLNALGHDIIMCDHGQGHTAPGPGMGGDKLIQFFADHPLGTTDSPYADGLPGDFADYCAFQGKT